MKNIWNTPLRQVRISVHYNRFIFFRGVYRTHTHPPRTEVLDYKRSDSRETCSGVRTVDGAREEWRDTWSAGTDTGWWDERMFCDMLTKSLYLMVYR